ncbi:hypothetical protein AGR1A_Cc40309 [Agrobacterium fabacearum CFBP 5771]|nr:hypothetical protein AGR1A_Cc40309 [Agrobacterium fabacearum CFBP 5771]
MAQLPVHYRHGADAIGDFLVKSMFGRRYGNRPDDMQHEERNIAGRHRHGNPIGRAAGQARY